MYKVLLLDGKCQISGGFEVYDEADDLATTIRIGALPIELKVLRFDVVRSKSLVQRLYRRVFLQRLSDS